MNIGLDLQKIEYALAVARHRSFSKAADALGITQPTLTRNIQALESNIGARVFDRSRAGVEPTPIGEFLLERGAKLTGVAQELRRDLRLFRGAEIGRLSIGAGPFPAAISVGRAVGVLVEKQPGLKIDVIVSDWVTLRQLVLDRQIDLAVAELSGADEDAWLATQPLEIHHGLFFCRKGHPLDNPRPVTFQDIARFPLASTVLPARMEILRRRDPDPSEDSSFFYPQIRADTVGILLDIVRGSDAISFATPGLLLEPWRRGELAILPVDLPSIRSNFGIVHLAGRTLSPSATRFIDIARQTDREVLKDDIALREKLLAANRLEGAREAEPG